MREYKIIAVMVLASTWAGWQPAKAQSLAGLDWLSGCWAGADEEAGSGEIWMSPAGGVMLGMSRTVKRGKIVAFEFMRIIEEGDMLTFIAQPSNQPQASFRQVRRASREVVFENVTHDFPQRVIYRLDSDGTLKPRIEGMQNGKLRVIEYPMERVACPAGPAR